MSLDPITLSILASRLAGIAEEMGAVLIRGAYSSNIKERRDCSSALFDAQGRLVAQAEHIPVHLGAMPDSVAAVMAREPAPGDVFMLNDPFAGGNHLPDITMVTPIAREAKIIGYAATRAHHSDMGGMRPGSMPSNSREIYQEGIIIPPVRLVRAGALDEEMLDFLLANVRTPRVRRGDLHAQIAANDTGRRRLLELIEGRGQDTVLAAFGQVIDYTERGTCAHLRELPDGTYRAESQIEGDGVTDADIPIRVAVTLGGDNVQIDFTGTSDAVAGNVNCPLTVTRAACYFALRCLLPTDLPANAGAYAPVTIHAPEGSLVNARRPSAVVAGNVETSQRIADTLIEALGQAAPFIAQGQGTMNNLIIGGGDWSYYETLAGGQGAGPDSDGASGVQVGMTNTLNTPIEALEMTYPLRVERYELRAGSGGDGKHRGGDGLMRALRLLAPARLSLISDRRRHPPQGAAGGSPGALGENDVNGENLGAKVGRDLQPGDIVTVRTPGGGGYGQPQE
jgi:N-methylhydantoinase B